MINISIPQSMSMSNRNFGFLYATGLTFTWSGFQAPDWRFQDSIGPPRNCSTCLLWVYDFSIGSLLSCLLVGFRDDFFDFSVCPSGLLLSFPLLRSGICNVNVNCRLSFPHRLSCCLWDESLPISIDRASPGNKKIQIFFNNSNGYLNNGADGIEKKDFLLSFTVQ